MSSKKNPYTSDSVAKVATGGALIFLGVMIACCCGGMSQMGDYVGPPSGLEEYKRTMSLRLIVSIVVGLIPIAIGTISLVKRKRNQNQDSQ